ncbi:hypothetical protein O1611_g3492 [Lasiodiplodia mahajangana]|uniref:Uncharacterized protein n=1 Tax=Lasiodiplodia mahajangana TaxID=1108764 RepID=A0ACC2JRP2_9PEZI|nr:hypothetical protein O1611_g3492 [Lasiodiplodia mahajangana]
MDDASADEFLAKLQSNSGGASHRVPDFAKFRYADGDTLLHRAAWRGKDQAVASLLQDATWKVLVNSRNNFDQTPLLLLCLECRELAEDGHGESIKKILKALLDNGADVNVQSKDGDTPLNLAIHRKSSFIALEILATGKADVNKPTFSRGATPLHIAANRGMLDVALALIDKGADLKLTTHTGESILSWALWGMEEDDITPNQVENTTSPLGLGSGDDYLWDFNDGGISIRSRNSGRASTAEPVVLNFGRDYGRDVDDGSISPRSHNGRGNGDQRGPSAGNGILNALVAALVGDDVWFQMLQLAYREPDLGLVQSALQRLYPEDYKDKEIPVKWLWMAMREDRFKDLEKEMRNAIKSTRRISPRETAKSCESWNALDLSVYLGIPQIVRWLLRGKHWTKLEKEHARSLLELDEDIIIGRAQKFDHRPSIWTEPFAKFGGVRGKKYNYPARRQDDSRYLTNLQSSVLDIYSDKNRFGFLCHSSKVEDLLYSGERSRTGPKPSMEAKVRHLRETVPGFGDNSVYSRSSFRFRWIHLPANCDTATITYLEKDENIDEIAKRFQFLENSWHQLPEGKSERKYMNPNCSRSNLPLSRDRDWADGHEETPYQLALYVPYIKCAPKPPNDQRSSYRLTSCCNPEDLELPFHEAQTLDTYHHGELAAQRDDHQVVSRYVEHQQEDDTACLSSDILQVGQLWLWVIDKETIVTGTSHSPEALDDASQDIDPVFEKILNRLDSNGKNFNKEAVFASMNSFVKFILGFYVNIADNLALDIHLEGLKKEHDIERARKPDISVPVYTIFASSIEEVNQKENDLRDSFRERMKTASTGDAAEAENIHAAVVDATNALAEIKDIRGELTMIRSVVRTQQRVWDQLFNRPAENGGNPDNVQNSSSWKSTDPDYVLGRTQTLLEFAHETEKNVESVLELRMNQLSLNEAENSRKLAENAGKQAEQARKQGQTVLVFTVVTVIFTPLSFLTSLFALNISTFPHSGEMVVYQPGWVAGILVGSLVIFSFLVWGAIEIYQRRLPQTFQEHLENLFPAKSSNKRHREALSQEVRDRVQQLPEVLRYLPGGWGNTFRRRVNETQTRGSSFA